MDLETAPFQVIGQNLFAITRKTSINIHGNQLILNRSAKTQLFEDVQQGIRVFPARDSDRNPVAIFDQCKIANRFSGQLLDFSELGVIEQHERQPASALRLMLT